MDLRIWGVKNVPKIRDVHRVELEALRDLLVERKVLDRAALKDLNRSSVPRAKPTDKPAVDAPTHKKKR